MSIYNVIFVRCINTELVYLFFKRIKKSSLVYGVRNKVDTFYDEILKEVPYLLLKCKSQFYLLAYNSTKLLY